MRIRYEIDVATWATWRAIKVLASPGQPLRVTLADDETKAVIVVRLQSGPVDAFLDPLPDLGGMPPAHLAHRISEAMFASDPPPRFLFSVT